MREAAMVLTRHLQNAGFTAYFAGGCVRDRLMGRTPDDYDIATDARPEQMKKLFPNAKWVGAHFGVVNVRSSGYEYQIATFRTDGSYTDGRRPESVEFSTPEEDAARRDFTVNGLFEEPESGAILDFVGGLADLKKKSIRAIGNARQRFEEDHLRLLRAVRFATVLEGFTIEDETWSAICHAAPKIQQIAPERIRAELGKIWAHPCRGHGFDLLVESGLMQAILPEIMQLRGCEQPPQWHPEGDVFTHTRIMLDLLPPQAPEELVLAVLLHDIAKPATASTDSDGRIRFNGHDRVGAEMAETILRRLRYPNDIIEPVVVMVRQHMNFMNVKSMRTAKLKHFMARSTFALELELHRADCLSSNGLLDNHAFLHEKQEEFAQTPLIPPRLVSGMDLLELGWQAGPELGRMLADIQTLQLEGELSTRADAINWLLARRPSSPADQ